MIVKVISGFQTGADIGGIKAAHKLGIPTGGWMPFGWRTQDGPKPEYEKLYGAKQHESCDYPPRTEENVKGADATIRFASDFQSAGEKCTLKFIHKHDKKYVDIDVKKPHSITTIANLLIENRVTTLNIAGNSERTSPRIGMFVELYCTKLFIYLLAYERGRIEGMRASYQTLPHGYDPTIN